MVKNTFEPAFVKVLTIVQKLNAKKGLNFYWNEIKVHRVAQKDYF